MIEKGRHFNLKVEERICPNCDFRVIQDEYHVVMTCKKYNTERCSLFSLFEENIHNWHVLNSQEQFELILSIEYHVIETGKFIKHILDEV